MTISINGKSSRRKRGAALAAEYRFLDLVSRHPEQRRRERRGDTVEIYQKGLSCQPSILTAILGLDPALVFLGRLFFPSADLQRLQRFHLTAIRLVYLKRSEGNVAVVEGPDVGFVRSRLVILILVPIINLAGGINPPLIELDRSPRVLRHHQNAFDLVLRQVGDVHVEERPRLHVFILERSDEIDHEFGGRTIVHGLSLGKVDRDRGDALEGRLSGGADGRRIERHCSNIFSPVDPHDDEVGRFLEQGFQGQSDAGGRHGLDDIPFRAVFLLLRDENRVLGRDAVACAARVLKRSGDGHCPDPGQVFKKRGDPRRVDAVVVGDEDLQRRLV